MTPLLYDYPDDELTYRISDQYMFGTAMMICPVTTKGALSRPVYFPGGKWVDFWTGERIEGRQHKSFLTPPDLMPIFIKEGAIIPKQPAMQYMGEKKVDEILLTIFPSGTSSYDLYEDDGKSLDYMKEVYSITSIKSMLKDGVWRLTIEKPRGKFVPDKHSYRIEAFWDSKPLHVFQNGKLLKEIPLGDLGQQEGWSYDEEMGKVWIKTNLTNRDIVQLQIE